jgi:hypothetical protein
LPDNVTGGFATPTTKDAWLTRGTYTGGDLKDLLLGMWAWSSNGEQFNAKIILHKGGKCNF